MSIVSNLAGRARRAVAYGPDIARRLEEAERELASLELQHGEIALDAVSGADGAQERLKAIAAQMANARDRISTLRAAHKVAIERDAATERQQRAQLQKTQIAAVRSHLAARDAAADALSAAIADASKQWRIMIERSEKAQAANPIGGSWPGGSMCDFGDLKRAVEEELYRFGGDPTFGSVAHFPGADPHDLTFVQQPDKLPALPETVRQASEHVLGVLTGAKGNG